MKHRIAKTFALALGLCVLAQPSWAADPQPKAAPASAKKPAAPQPAPVDINSASREELKKLPGIGNAEADRIVAGRPYLSKAHLQTRNVVSPLVYQGLRDRVVARQKDAKFGKVSGK
jgi:DNA uptake protein ComE-like DNA-binding protein